MPALALPAFWGAIGAGAAGGAAIYGANKQSQSTDRALTAQTTANTQAMDFERQQEAERKREFDQQQAEAKRQWDAEQQLNQAQQQFTRDQWNYDVQRRAPYLAASNQALLSLGDLLGMDFSSVRQAAANPPSGLSMGDLLPSSRPAPTIDASKGDVGPQISAYFKAQGVGDQETPYWVAKWPELVARGQQLNDPQYAAKRLAAADVFAGRG